MGRLFHLLSLALLVPLLDGCALLQLRADARGYYAATVLAGRVSAPEEWQRGVSVVAVEATAGTRRIVHHVWLHEPGGYELIVPRGTYTVHAFADADGTGASEDATLHAASPPIAVDDSGTLTQVDLVLADAEGIALPVPARPVAMRSTQAGAVADLSDPLFSDEWGRRGYWAPMETFRQIGGSIHFTAPYDPSRTPVLFVHGAAGSAQAWKAFVPALGDGYQAWLFQYPSGASLDAMSHLLYWKLLNLRARYGFTRLHVVAYSMGGLLARRFMLDHGDEFPELGMFVSLSTPWAGDARASLGVARSPAVVPSWRDMQPEGEFLQRLFASPLPSHVRHTLMFSYRGASPADKVGDDGTVTLASQLRRDAEAQAWQVSGYDEDHAGILAAPHVHADVMRLLADADAVAQPASAQVRLRLRGADPADIAGAVPLLLLFSADPDAASTRVLPLDAADRDALARRLPAGRYRLQPVVPGYRVATAPLDVALTAGETADLDIDVVPQGLVHGHVRIDASALAPPAGAPVAGEPAMGGMKIEIEGAGIRRALVAAQAADSSRLLASWSTGKDAAAGAWFGFADLPAGLYRISAHLPGHASASAEYRVTPGTSSPPAALVIHAPSRKRGTR